MNAAIRRFINSQFTDVATVMRIMHLKGVDGSTHEVWSTVYALMPCRLSQRSSWGNSSGGMKERQSHSQWNGRYTVFCSNEMTIYPGDKLFVTQRTGPTFECIAGSGFRYDFHTEIGLAEAKRV